MPKQRITREQIVEAAFALMRERGLESLTVARVAEGLSCSVQPIYTYCESMDGLRELVCARTNAFVEEYVRTRVDRDDLFRSTGHAYAALAREEPHIFRTFIFQARPGVSSLSDLYARHAAPGVNEAIRAENGVSSEKARDLHLDMLIYTLGLGVIQASAVPGISEREAAERLEHAYEAFAVRNTHIEREPK